jgi:hypothetical protein
MSATIHKLDDYRKTPRAAVRHEVAMIAVDGYHARQQREDIERLEAYKAEFARQCNWRTIDE